MTKTHRYERIGEVKFDREIVGILIGRYQTEDMSSQTGNMDLHNPNNSTYQTQPMLQVQREVLKISIGVNLKMGVVLREVMARETTVQAQSLVIGSQ